MTSQDPPNNQSQLQTDGPRTYNKDYTPLDDLYDQTTNDAPIHQKLQELVNTPPIDPAGLDESDEQYLKKVMKLIENGQIDFLKPRTLINEEVYKNLKPEQEIKTDINTQSLIARLKDIHNLWQLDHVFSYQIINLIQSVRAIKSRVESDCGDVYVI